MTVEQLALAFLAVPGLQVWGKWLWRKTPDNIVGGALCGLVYGLTCTALAAIILSHP